MLWWWSLISLLFCSVFFPQWNLDLLNLIWFALIHEGFFAGLWECVALLHRAGRSILPAQRRPGRAERVRPDGSAVEPARSAAEQGRQCRLWRRWGWLGFARCQLPQSAVLLVRGGCERGHSGPESPANFNPWIPLSVQGKQWTNYLHILMSCHVLLNMLWHTRSRFA